ncbi:MAG: ABC transporter substrate-binding protein [Actinomycetota bacterium]|nr:ABC transporter substrate-binding protein [Actinomycetota bacterium]
MFLNFIQKNRNTSLFFINVSLAVIIIFLLLCSGGCGKADNGRDVNHSGTNLYVGCDPTYPIFEFMEDGEIKGFDIDIASEIADRMEKDLEIVTIDWESSYQIPEDVKLDMIISAVPISPDKDNVVDFSIPYFTMEYMLIVLDEADIKIEENLEDAPVGVLTSEENYLDEDYLLNFKIENYEGIVMMIDALKNREIDAILLSLPVGVNLITGDTGIYRVLEVIKSGKEFGIVFSEGSALKEEVDEIIEEIKNDGTYDEIYTEWFDYES